MLLDSIMHSDIQPFAAFSNNNGLLSVISIDHLHILTAIFGIFGGTMLLVLLVRRKLVAENTD